MKIMKIFLWKLLAIDDDGKKLLNIHNSQFKKTTTNNIRRRRRKLELEERKVCAKRLHECDNSCFGSSLIFSSENF